ncbi:MULTISPECIES: family 43 glycosylhydrolase [unclassified Sphingomonas]|uniref:family 43 glycosylhydrolase n=1 Tax=unclassified Sphingomonas TaxID=196159 RepID=UPI00226AD996|nr:MULTISPECIES: family 43 glycosylhydrolase [unclassified Sphingomonas]
MVSWKNVVACTTAALLPIGALPAASPPAAVNNGSQFVDNNGQPLQAHGAGIIKVGSYYYMLGENRNGYLFKAVSMYKSTDLKTWTYDNDILTANSAPSLNTSNLERPKVIYNAGTRKYVLWAHKENGQNYNDAEVVVATSDTVDGNYVYQSEFRPLNYESRDMTLFADTDGNAYLISAANNNYDLNIYKLNASYTGIDSLVTTLGGNHREAPAVFKRNGVYFLLTSAATGWNPNQAAYQTATSMAGPWTSPTTFGDPTTYNSQSTYVQPIVGTSGTGYLYLGDRWGPATNQNPNDSTYVWLPITFPSNTSIAMPTSSQITIDTAAGTIANGYSGTTLVTMKVASSGLCANVANQSRNYESGLIQWGCTTDSNEQVERRSIGGYTQFVLQQSGLCIAEGDGNSNVVQTTCGIGNRSQWTISGKQIINRNSGRCLNVSGDSRDPGGNLITYACSSDANEQWSFVS